MRAWGGAAEDPLSNQGRRLHSRAAGNSTLEVWAKHLSDGAVAVVLFNHCRQTICRPVSGAAATSSLAANQPPHLPTPTTGQPNGTYVNVNVTLAGLGLTEWPAADVRNLLQRQGAPRAGGPGGGSVSAWLGPDAVAIFKLTKSAAV